MTVDGTGPNRRFLLAVVSLAAVLRILQLGSQSLWIDEFHTLVVATPKPGYPIGQLLLHNVHGPLFTSLIFLSRMLSEGEAWLRLPSALAGAAAVAYCYLWARLWTTERIGRYAALLLAVNPLHVLYSQELRGYSFVLLFGLAACYHLERLCERYERRDALAYAFVMAAAALSSFTAALLYAAHTIVWFVRRGVRAGPTARWVGIGVVILVLISPWIYRIGTYIDVGRLVTPVAPGDIPVEERLRGRTTATLEALPYTFYAYSVGFSLGPSLRDLHVTEGLRGVVSRHWAAIAWTALLFGSLAVAGAAAAVRRHRRGLEMAAYLAAPLLLTFALNWQNAKAFNVRYVLLGLPAFVALIAMALHRLRPRARMVAGALVVVTAAVSLFNYYFDGDYAREDVRGAVRYIEQQEGPTCILAPTVFDVVAHYYDRPESVHTVFGARGVPVASVERQLARVFAACNALWYLRARPWVDDPQGVVHRRVEARYRRVEAIEFDGVEVFRYQGRKDH